jgi:hypothetical protein
MQLEDQTFLTIMDKLMSSARPKQKSVVCAKLKACIEYRASGGESDSYLYVVGSDGATQTSISLGDLKEIARELEV